VLLKKGNKFTDNYKNFQSVPSEKIARKRALQTSDIAVLFKKYDIKFSDIFIENENCFIPSAYWRKIRLGIISTSRFLGMLIYRGIKFAVYDIDENMEWQGMAEISLFYWHHGAYETKADAMLMICRNNSPQMAKQIIQRTMWDRKKLIKHENYSFEPDKPQRYSKSPIRLKSNYNRVLLCDWEDFKSVLDYAVDRDKILKNYQERLGGNINNSGIYGRSCDIEVYPNRYFINLENDLLRFVYLWDHVKWQNREHDGLYYNKIDYHLIMREKYKIFGEKIGCDTVYVDV